MIRAGVNPLRPIVLLLFVFLLAHSAFADILYISFDINGNESAYLSTDSGLTVDMSSPIRLGGGPIAGGISYDIPVVTLPGNILVMDPNCGCLSAWISFGDSVFPTIYSALGGTLAYIPDLADQVPPAGIGDSARQTIVTQAMLPDGTLGATYTAIGSAAGGEDFLSAMLGYDYYEATGSRYTGTVTEFDYTFGTSTVPEPASLILLSTVLLGCARFARKVC